MFYEVQGNVISESSISHVEPDGTIHVGGKEIKGATPQELEELRRHLKVKKMAPQAGNTPEQQANAPKFNPDLTDEDQQTNSKSATAAKKLLHDKSTHDATAADPLGDDEQGDPKATGKGAKQPHPGKQPR